MRRILAAATIAAVAVTTPLVRPAPALAASLVIASPTADATVTTSVPVEVDVTRSLAEPVEGVEVRLVSDDLAGDPVALECIDDAGCAQVGDFEDRWGGVVLAADGSPWDATAVCNGAHRLEARVTGDDGWAASTRVVLSSPPRPVDDLAASVDGDVVTLRWTAPSAPDVRLVVQRRDAGGWDELADLAPGSSTWSGRTPAGTHEHRVVAVRGDGWADDSPARPCADAERDHVVPGTPSSVTVAAADGRTTPVPAPTAAASEGGDPASDDPGDGTAPTRRVAAPPPAAETTSTASAPRLASPAPPAVEDADDGGYRDELDYAGIAPVAATPSPTGALSSIRDPIAGAGRDPRRILIGPVGGLTAIAAALWLRRWARGT